jgi:uncharacterized protein with GYD domain
MRADEGKFWFLGGGWYLKNIKPAALRCHSLGAGFFCKPKGGFLCLNILCRLPLRDGVKGLAKEGGSKRRQAVEKFFGSAGEKLEALYFAFGETDVFVIADFPDNLSAAALSLAANAAGAVQVKATVLISPEEMDQAAQKSLGLRPPTGA